MEARTVRRGGLARMWTILVLSCLLLAPLGVLSNMTHSLLLTLEVYHLLYSVLTLCGWLLAARLADAPGSAKKTFGWARLEVLGVVTTLLFLAALCFSVSVEAIQSLAHAAHSDDMHHPLYVLASAAAVLLLNLVCCVLVGGYTSVQSTMLAPGEATSQLSPASSEVPLRPSTPRWPTADSGQLVRQFVRDVGGTLLLVVSAVTSYLCRTAGVRYLDPALALLAVGLLVYTSWPLFSKCCLILLQTMPADFDAESFRARLLATLPAVQDVHELHVWQLTSECAVATAHVVLTGPQQFNDVAERVTALFAEYAVGLVTLQPEFSGAPAGGGPSRCLLPCSVDSCAKARCCYGPAAQCVPTIRVTCPSQPSLASLTSGRGSGDNADNCCNRCADVNLAKSEERGTGEESQVDSSTDCGKDDPGGRKPNGGKLSNAK